MSRLVAKRYAKALYDLAVEANNIDQYIKEVMQIKEAIRSDNKLLLVLKHPQISASDKTKLVAEIFKDNISKDIAGFIYVIFNKQRGLSLGEILDEFINICNKERGILIARVDSAVKLREDDLRQISDKLSIKLDKQIVISQRVLPELIGGVKISVGGIVIDNTIKAHINSVKKQLMNISLIEEGV